MRESETIPRDPSARPRRRLWTVALIGVALVAAALGAVRSFDVYGQRHVWGVRMGLLPRAIARGDRIIYRHDPVEMGPFEQSGPYFMGRVAGLPGEDAALIGAVVVIDGKPLDSSTFRTYAPRRSGGVGRLGDGQYFVLSDDERDQVDSCDRRFGAISRDRIEAIAIFATDPGR
jgi:hypothetical protein